MLRFAVYEDFNDHIVQGVRRRNPAIDLVRVQNVGLSGAVDPEVLHWAAQTERVVLTHDVSTMSRHAYRRVEDGLRMPGVFEVSQDARIRGVIEDFLLLAECSHDGEWEGQVRYLPLQ